MDICVLAFETKVFRTELYIFLSFAHKTGRRVEKKLYNYFRTIYWMILYQTIDILILTSFGSVKTCQLLNTLRENVRCPYQIIVSFLLSNWTNTIWWPWAMSFYVWSLWSKWNHHTFSKAESGSGRHNEFILAHCKHWVINSRFIYWFNGMCVTHWSYLITNQWRDSSLIECWIVFIYIILLTCFFYYMILLNIMYYDYL